MKKFAILAVAALTLAACSGTPTQPTAELQGLQDRCSAGDMTACSDLAHAVKS
ncbi:hypothetical protein [uncultured Shimia sp.]|uniref:hypothetical protein n=1 Tax=uncultured Shimia sp. TaxID=573152 RepID=UPI00260E7863|nr:hypothetical protein [uncultured Shimia sp.]